MFESLRSTVRNGDSWLREWGRNDIPYLRFSSLLVVLLSIGQLVLSCGKLCYDFRYSDRDKWGESLQGRLLNVSVLLCISLIGVILHLRYLGNPFGNVINGPVSLINNYEFQSLPNVDKDRLIPISNRGITLLREIIREYNESKDENYDARTGSVNDDNSSKRGILFSLDDKDSSNYQLNYSGSYENIFDLKSAFEQISSVTDTLRSRIKDEDDGNAFERILNILDNIRKDLSILMDDRIDSIKKKDGSNDPNRDPINESLDAGIDGNNNYGIESHSKVIVSGFDEESTAQNTSIPIDKNDDEKKVSVDSKSIRLSGKDDTDNPKESKDIERINRIRRREIRKETERLQLIKDREDADRLLALDDERINRSCREGTITLRCYYPFHFRIKRDKDYILRFLNDDQELYRISVPYEQIVLVHRLVSDLSILFENGKIKGELDYSRFIYHWNDNGVLVEGTHPNKIDMNRESLERYLNEKFLAWKKNSYPYLLLFNFNQDKWVFDLNIMTNAGEHVMRVPLGRISEVRRIIEILRYQLSFIDGLMGFVHYDRRPYRLNTFNTLREMIGRTFPNRIGTGFESRFVKPNLEPYTEEELRLRKDRKISELGLGSLRCVSIGLGSREIEASGLDKRSRVIRECRKILAYQSLRGKRLIPFKNYELIFGIDDTVKGDLNQVFKFDLSAQLMVLFSRIIDNLNDWVVGKQLSIKDSCFNGGSDDLIRIDQSHNEDELREIRTGIEDTGVLNNPNQRRLLQFDTHPQHWELLYIGIAETNARSFENLNLLKDQFGLLSIIMHRFVFVEIDHQSKDPKSYMALRRGILEDFLRVIEDYISTIYPPLISKLGSNDDVVSIKASTQSKMINASSVNHDSIEECKNKIMHSNRRSLMEKDRRKSRSSRLNSQILDMRREYSLSFNVGNRLSRESHFMLLQGQYIVLLYRLSIYLTGLMDSSISANYIFPLHWKDDALHHVRESIDKDRSDFILKLNLNLLNRKGIRCFRLNDLKDEDFRCLIRLTKQKGFKDSMLCKLHYLGRMNNINDAIKDIVLLRSQMNGMTSMIIILGPGKGMMNERDYKNTLYLLNDIPDRVRDRLDSIGRNIDEGIDRILRLNIRLHSRDFDAYDESHWKGIVTRLKWQFNRIQKIHGLTRELPSGFMRKDHDSRFVYYRSLVMGLPSTNIIEGVFKGRYPVSYGARNLEQCFVIGMNNVRAIHSCYRENFSLDRYATVGYPLVPQGVDRRVTFYDEIVGKYGSKFIIVRDRYTAYRNRYYKYYDNDSSTYLNTHMDLVRSDHEMIISYRSDLEDMREMPFESMTTEMKVAYRQYDLMVTRFVENTEIILDYENELLSNNFIYYKYTLQLNDAI